MIHMNFNTNKISSLNVFLSKYLRRTLSTALLAASLMVLPYATANTQVVNGSIEFTKEYGLLTQEILQLLDKEHYQNRTLNDQFSSDV